MTSRDHIDHVTSAATEADGYRTGIQHVTQTDQKPPGCFRTQWVRK